MDVPDSLSILAGLLDRHLAAAAATCLFPLACYILLSGLDDLALDLCWVYRLIRRRRPAPAAPETGEPAVALFIPCWQEAAVIGDMLRHNLASIAYSNYDVFVGAYPNDQDTIRAVLEVSATHPRVHLALVPHDGPTSKADCLNWIYQRLLLWEECAGRRADVVAIHDAEDLIHPRSLELYGSYCRRHGMVQLPVLPLATSALELTHGVYCDDFAESQGKDLETRVSAGAFLPGCGVGTAFRRETLERLAANDANRLFQPSSLTEDYDNGYRLSLLGEPQVFIPLEITDGAPVGTREYFPRRFRQAVRQRSRWVTGNSLQAWERFGWGRRAADAWFLWRDRKGLWGNAISLMCNVLLLYGMASWTLSTAAGRPWLLRELVRQSPGFDLLLLATSALFASRIAFRMAAVVRVYGVVFALGVPIRMVWGNVINTLATARALWTWGRARALGRPLVWVKTEHAYPTRGALLVHKRRIGEILVEHTYCSREDVERALETRVEGQRLGERLIEMGVLTEIELYEALSLQQSLPTISSIPAGISSRIARALPAKVVERLQVLPFRIEAGELFVAGPRIPDDAMHDEIRRFTRLDVRFHLMTPSEFAGAMRRLELTV